MLPSIIIVPDTNVLLHSQQLDQIPWRELVDASTVEIVLVSQVLRELDAKKNGDNEKLRKRARRVLSAINSWLPSGTSKVEIANCVMLSVHVREPAPIEGLDFSVGDDRILGAALQVADPERLTIATGDITMRFKAEAHRLKVLEVPDAYRVREDPVAGVAVARPKLVAGLFGDDGSGPLTNLAVQIGISVNGLIGLAENELMETEHVASQFPPSAAAYVQRGRIEPTEHDWAEYIRKLRQFGKQHAQTVHFTIGVKNVGDAPADDVVVEFTFPEYLLVHPHEPELPACPEPRDYSLLASRLLSVPAQTFSVPTVTFDVERHERKGCVAIIKAGRLMQSKSAVFSAWTSLEGKSLVGFPIAARVLAASPPITLDADMNIRFKT